MTKKSVVLVYVLFFYIVLHATGYDHSMQRLNRVLVCVVAAVREQCIETGLVKVLLPHLNSSNQEMLLNTGRAIGRICFDNCEFYLTVVAQ